MYLIGLFPPSDGNMYCLTMIERFTNWVEVVPLSKMTAETIAKGFHNSILNFSEPRKTVVKWNFFIQLLSIRSVMTKLRGYTANCIESISSNLISRKFANCIACIAPWRLKIFYCAEDLWQDKSEQNQKPPPTTNRNAWVDTSKPFKVEHKRSLRILIHKNLRTSSHKLELIEWNKF